MTTATVDRREWWRFDVSRSEGLLQGAILLFIVVSSLAGAFTHMHDWTREALPKQADWLCWSNAVISELLPTSAFLSMRKRQRQKRSVSVPVSIFLGSACLSMCAQLSATGVRLPYDTQALACLPAVALLILSKVIFGDVEYSRKAREAAEQKAARKAVTQARRAAHAAQVARRDAELAAEHAAELARNQAREAAELARNQEREAAELAAELRRQDAELAAELERERLRVQADAEARRTQIEQTAITEREQAKAAERAAERAAQERREARDAETRRLAQVERARIEAQAQAERERIAAEAEAERVRAEAARVAAEAAEKRQAAALLADHERRGEDGDVGGGEPAGPRRMRRADRRRLIDAALAGLPDGTTRAEAVVIVAKRLDVAERYVRDFVPQDWVAGSSADGSVGGEDSSAQRLRLVAAGGR
jgi:hypothetical protein